MAAVPASRPKPEHLLLKWAGTVLGKSEDEWTDVDAFKDGRLLLELLDRLWLGGSSGKQLERDANQGPEDQSRKPQSARDTASQNEGPGFECGVKKVTEPEPELTPCISPRTLAVKGKEAGVNLDVRTLEKVKEGDGAALHETLLSVYRPWIMQNGQKGVRRVSKGQISDTPEKGSGSKIVEDSSRASGRGSGSKKMEADQGGEIRAGAEETLAADLSGQSKLVAGMGEESGAEVVNRQQDSERPAEVLKGVRKVTSTIRSEEEKVAKVVTGAEALGGSAISAGLSPGAAYAAPAVAEPSQPGKKARANVLKRLNTKAKAGLVAGQMEKISSPVSAGDTFGGAGDKDQSAVSPSLVDGVETADLVQKEREGIDVTGFGEKWGVASGLEGRQESLQVREGENDGSSLLVQDKKVILSSSPKLESQSGSTKTRLAKLTGLGKAAVPGTAGGDGEGAKWQAPLPLRSAYSASDAQLTSARAWLADIIAGVSADVGDCEGPPYPPECESGAAHVRACELLLDTSSESELRQSGGDDAVSMTERRVAFVYEQLRVHGVRVSNLRRRKRSSGGAIDGEKLGAEAEIELTETLMSAAAELGMSVPRAVERIRELTGVKEHPYDWEDALQLWVNAVLADHHSTTPVEDGKVHGGLLCIDDLLVDLSDGRALAVLLHYLSPSLIDPRGIPLDRHLSRSETAHVIGLVQQAAHTIRVPFPLTPADLIYGHAGVKPALLYFLAAVFRTFEQKEPLLPLVRKVSASKGPNMASEPRAVRSGETTSASPPSRITEPQKTESPHQRVFSKFLGSSREVEVPEVSSSSGRPESGRSRVASRRSSSGRSPSRLPISPTAKVSAEPSRSARGTQDSRGAEGPVEEREEGPRSGSDTVGERLGIESSGSQDVEERPAERSPLASRMSSKHPSRTPSASASRATSPDSSRLTSARSSGRLAVSPTMIPTAGVATLDRKMSLTESSADVTGFVSALPSASMMSEDARAVRQANLWALLNRAEANAATAAASLSLVRERLSEELSTGTGSERTLNGSPETTRIGKSGVGRGSGKKGSSARMSAEVVKVRRVDEGVARASSAPVPLAEFRFVGGLEDEDMVRIGEPGTVELSSEFSGSSMGVSGLAEREDRAGVNRRSPGERERDVRKRMKKLSLRTHPLEKSETVESERLQSGFKEAVGDEVARNEAGTERKTERSAFEPSAATMGSLLASQQGREESDVPSTKAGAGKSLDLARLSLESPTGSIFRVRDALKSASSPVETRNPSGAEVPRLSLPGGFTSPASASPQTGRSSARGTGPKSYRSRANRVLSTERSVEARKSLEAQFRLLEEQKAESDRKRNEGSEVRKSLDERRAALVRRSQEGVAGFAGWLRGTSARANEGLATGSVGSGTGDGSILRVLTERLSRSTGGSEGDVAEALGDVGGVLTSEPAELAEGGVKGRVELIESELPGGLNAADGHDVSRAVSEARSAEALKESGMVPDKRRPAELPRGTPDVADLGLKVRAPAESLPKPSAREPSSVDSLKLSVEYARLFIDPLAASPELQTDPGNLKSSSESVSRSADALLSGSVERVERSERKEIDWGSLDSDSPVRRTEFPSDSESSGPLGGTFRAERNTLPEKKAVDWGTLLTGVGLDVSSDVSRLDDSIESRGEAEPTAAKAVQNQEGLGEQQGSSLWGDEGHVSKWDRRWSPESMHADVMHPEVDENEGRGGADKLFSKEDLENGLSPDETEREIEPSPRLERHPPKPPKPVALHLIDRDDSEKRARMQRALDEKRAQFLLERQLQQVAAATSRRPTDDSSQKPETLPGSSVPSGKRRSSGSSAEASDVSFPDKGGGGSRPQRDSGASADVSRRVADGPAEGGPSGKASRRGSGMSEGSNDKASRRVSGVSPFYAAPPRMSNKKLVRNALSAVCLAGGALRLDRERALMALDAFDGDNFVILFKDDKGTKFKGLYVLSADGKEIDRIYGSGPESLRSDSVAHYFKYDSGAKEFKPLPTQQFTTSTCAVAPSNRVPGKRPSR